jgi:hypothetical protein
MCWGVKIESGMVIKAVKKHIHLCVIKMLIIKIEVF